MNNEQLQSPTLIKSIDGFDIFFTPLVEHHPLDVDIYEAADLEKLIQQIDSYQLVYFCACITAEKSGVQLGFSSLGCCIYETFDAFIKYIEDDMINEAVKEAKERILELTKQTTTL